MAKTPKEKAFELVKYYFDYWAETDIYWNPTNAAKDNAKESIRMISENSEYWQEVIKEIDLINELSSEDN
ncbi:hypothetical protein AAW12_08655 [Sphingobacterium sp. Ag1]|uniref:hypothetical protein n=1 Tax=Sphingobacterium sp. Ag1 TaxID=1643451 RepID=UPI000627B11B|nr:hypothetical protein [Sphingobacterium sp. Ag1]KKO91722.1 hypothetical protein AAW12_08655 [Sphingobacterium sp. Ag1]